MNWISETGIRLFSVLCYIVYSCLSVSGIQISGGWNFIRACRVLSAFLWNLSNSAESGLSEAHTGTMDYFWHCFFDSPSV